MRDVDPFDCDLSCASCGYSLRGCDSSDQCPECGYPVCTTLAHKVGAPGDIACAEQLAAAAKSAAVPLGAARLVIRAVRQALLTRSSMGYAAGGAGAGEICQAVIELVEERASGSKRCKELLRSRELLTSAAVGRVVGALVAAELLAPSEPGESLQYFERLDLIEKWLAS